MSYAENYRKYRGKCWEFCEALAKKNPELKIVKGFYYEPIWGREDEHVWLEDKTGAIVDPTAKQFPSGCQPEHYRKFDGTFDCSECGVKKLADDMYHEGRYHFCSSKCYGRFVGVF